MGGVVTPHPLFFLSAKARERMYWIGKGENLPDEVSQPWVLRTLTMFEEAPFDSRHTVRFYLPIPRNRLADFMGGPLPAREAAIRSEGVYRLTDARTWHHMRTVDRLICSPAPAGWGWGYDSDRRSYCQAHCSRCGLHFSSDKAFEQHTTERHKHPSKSKKLQAVTGRDTGCANGPTHHDVPINKYLPLLNQTSRFVPGVRVWEHVDAQRVRDYWAGRAAS